MNRITENDILETIEYYDPSDLTKLFNRIYNYFVVKYLKLNVNDEVIFKEKYLLKLIVYLFLKYWQNFFKVNISLKLGEALHLNNNNVNFMEFLELLNDLKILTYLKRFGWNTQVIDELLQNVYTTFVFLYYEDDDPNYNAVETKLRLSLQSAKQCIKYLKDVDVDKYKIPHIDYVRVSKSADKIFNLYSNFNEVYDKPQNAYINRDLIIDVILLVKPMLNNDPMEVEELSGVNSMGARYTFDPDTRKRKREGDDTNPKAAKARPEENIIEDYSEVKQKLPLDNNDAYIKKLFANYKAFDIEVEESLKFLKNYFIIYKEEDDTDAMDMSSTNSMGMEGIRNLRKEKPEFIYSEDQFENEIKTQIHYLNYNLIYNNIKKLDVFYRGAKKFIYVEVQNNKWKLYKFKNENLSQNLFKSYVLQIETLSPSIYLNIFETFKPYLLDEDLGRSIGRNNNQYNTLWFKNYFEFYTLKPQGNYNEIRDYPYENGLFNNVYQYSILNGYERQPFNTYADFKIGPSLSISQLMWKPLYRYEEPRYIQIRVNKIHEIKTYTEFYYYVKNVIVIMHALRNNTNYDRNQTLKEIDNFTGINQILKNMIQTVKNFCFTKNGDTYNITNENDFKVLYFLFIKLDLNAIKNISFKIGMVTEATTTMSNNVMSVFLIKRSEANDSIIKTSNLCKITLFLEFLNDEVLSSLIDTQDKEKNQMENNYTIFDVTLGDNTDVTLGDNPAQEKNILMKELPSEVAEMFFLKEDLYENSYVRNKEDKQIYQSRRIFSDKIQIILPNNTYESKNFDDVQQIFTFEQLLSLLILGIPIPHKRESDRKDIIEKQNIYQLKQKRNLNRVIENLCTQIGFNDTETTKIKEYLNNLKWTPEEETTVKYTSFFDVKTRNYILQVNQYIFTVYSNLKLTYPQNKTEYFIPRKAVVDGDLNIDTSSTEVDVQGDFNNLYKIKSALRNEMDFDGDSALYNILYSLTSLSYVPYVFGLEYDKLFDENLHHLLLHLLYTQEGPTERNKNKFINYGLKLFVFGFNTLQDILKEFYDDRTKFQKKYNLFNDQTALLRTSFFNNIEYKLFKFINKVNTNNQISIVRGEGDLKGKSAEDTNWWQTAGKALNVLGPAAKKAYDTYSFSYTQPKGIMYDTFWTLGLGALDAASTYYAGSSKIENIKDLSEFKVQSALMKLVRDQLGKELGKNVDYAFKNTNILFNNLKNQISTMESTELLIKTTVSGAFTSLNVVLAPTGARIPNFVVETTTRYIKEEVVKYDSTFVENYINPIFDEFKKEFKDFKPTLPDTDVEKTCIEYQKFLGIDDDKNFFISKKGQKFSKTVYDNIKRRAPNDNIIKSCGITGETLSKELIDENFIEQLRNKYTEKFIEIFQEENSVALADLLNRSTPTFVKIFAHGARYKWGKGRVEEFVVGWADEWLSINTRALNLANDNIKEGIWDYVPYVLPPLSFTVRGLFYYYFPQNLNRLQRERYIDLAVDAVFWIVLALTPSQVETLAKSLIPLSSFQFFYVQMGSSLLIYIARRGVKTVIKYTTDTNFTLYTFKKSKTAVRPTGVFVPIRNFFSRLI